MHRKMASVDAYRHYAAQCVKMAQRSEDLNEKAVLMEMAAKWLRLADFVEKYQVHPSIAPI